MPEAKEKKRSLNVKRILVCVCIFMIIFILSLIVSPSTGTGSVKNSTTQTNKQTYSIASKYQMEHIAYMLKKGNTLSDVGYIVKSNSHNNIFFVAAKINNSKIGVWTVSGTDSGMVLAVNNIAINASDCQNIRKTKAAEPDEEFSEAFDLEKYAAGKL